MQAFEQFFFIRYYERGKHIRLRFKSDIDKADNIIKPLIVEYFNDYFKNNPSKKGVPDYVQGFLEDQKWFPDNSFQFIDYEPEIDRYGGPQGMEISEEHFQICSETVLNALNESAEWSYSKSMGTAIQLMVSFCFAAGMNTKQMTDFFSYYCDMSISTALKSDSTEEKIDNINEAKLKLLLIYEEKYNAQKDFYIRFHKDLINSLTNEYVFEEEWFNDWIKKNNHISGKLNDLFDKGELIIPARFTDNFVKEQGKIYKLFYIYFSYMHMTYNRLGLANKDESYLCYLIKESLKNS
jgi:hypothetical protein